MSPDPHFRPEGFTGQHLVVLPDAVIGMMRNHPLLRPLFLSDTGCFPEAPDHRVSRPNGVPELILIACVSGCGWVKLGEDDPVSVEADEIIFIPMNTPHLYGSAPKKPWSIVWAHCHGEDLPHWIQLLGITRKSPVICLPPGAINNMEFSTMYEGLEKGYSETSLLTAAARLRMIFAEINRLRISGHSSGRAREQGLQQSLQWMQQHLNHPGDLSELARIAGLSIPHYSTLFQRKTGFAPINYFLRLKIQRACLLLDTTALSIQEIAAAVGFEDPFYFSRLFKKIMERSPRGYRKIQKG